MPQNSTLFPDDAFETGTSGRDATAAPQGRRKYEHKLKQRGRKFINVDLDAKLVEKLDEIRGETRRGVILEQLLAAALRNYSKAASPMY